MVAEPWLDLPKFVDRNGEVKQREELGHRESARVTAETADQPSVVCIEVLVERRDGREVFGDVAYRWGSGLMSSDGCRCPSKIGGVERIAVGLVDDRVEDASGVALQAAVAECVGDVHALNEQPDGPVGPPGQAIFAAGLKKGDQMVTGLRADDDGDAGRN